MGSAIATDPNQTITVAAPRPTKPSHFWAGKSFSFHDLLDAINPLQHIPVVGTVYRAVTGDTIGNAARVAGDTLFGGVIGAVSGLIDVAVKELTGEDIGEHVLATIGVQPAEAAEAAPPPTPAASVSAPAAAPTAALASAGAQTTAPTAQSPDSPSPLPKFGSATTSSMLEAASPVTPLDVMKALPPNSPAATPIAPAAPPPHFIPIDVSDKGIMAMRAHSGIKTAASAPATPPVPLNPPPGTVFKCERRQAGRFRCQNARRAR